MAEKINILCATDNNYAPYHGVMLTSLLMNNQDCQFDIYMLSDDTWNDEDTKKFDTLCHQYDSEFHLIKVNNEAIKDFPQREHITLPTYYRLLACNLLPENIDKVLLLDGDIIVRGNISSLWKIDIEGFAFAAAEDMDSITRECFERLNYDSKYGYCNAGVSLYNFKYWRENHISEQMIQLIKENPDTLKWMDQDAINLLLHDKRYNLPLRYNLQVTYLSNKYWYLYSEERQKYIKEECEHAIIIHYNGPVKPWTYRYLGYPYCETWKLYNNSFWNIDINQPRIYYFKHLLKRIFYPPMVFRSRNSYVVKEYWNYK